MRNYLQHKIEVLNTSSCISLLIMFVVILYLIIKYSINLFDTLLIGFLCYAITIYTLSDQAVKPYKKGLSGERKVLKTLEKLPNIKSFYDIVLPNKKGNIDFVIICNSGAYILEVKSFENISTKNLWFAGNQSKSNAFKLHKYLAEKLPHQSIPFFTPVVVLTKPFNIEDIHVSHNEVFKVVGLEDLKSLFSGQNNLSSEVIESINAKLNELTDIT